MDHINDLIRNKKVAVTGGAGTIGSLMVKKILEYDPSVIRVIDVDETGLFELEESLKSNKVRYLLGDIRDKERMKQALNGIDIVFHMAALKHVKSCEYNSFEAIKTNIIGLQNVIDVCIEENVERFVFTSTDKAANPVNVMGTTKLLGEKLVTAANYYKGNRKSMFSSVRFGNVLGSNGSVIEVFRNQIANNNPVTLTDGEMTRFVMSPSEAIDLILNTAITMKGGEVFILKMPCVKMIDFTNSIIEELCKDPSSVEIVKIGPKPGEKQYEELMTKEESKRALETSGMFIILPDMKEIKRSISEYNNSVIAPIKEYTSNDIVLNKDETRKFLINSKCL